jgi:hypothetical protein
MKLVFTYCNDYCGIGIKMEKRVKREILQFFPFMISNKR